MLKFLFFDGRDVESIKGFTRRLERPKKRRDNPIFRPRAEWQNGKMSLYGNVIRRPDGLFQMWYCGGSKAKKGGLCYAESDDGLEWRQPRVGNVKYKGKRTNIVFTQRPHGPSVIYDAQDPDEAGRYKMISGAFPSNRIGVFRSPDGINWEPAWNNPVIPTNPDCPMSLQRQEDGRYVVYVRPYFADRRVGRSESWDFREWTAPRMVLEPMPGDPAQLQFYGMGTIQYGVYEIGTVWMYHTVLEDNGYNKMDGYQEAELTYSRGGYCWHRAAQGEPYIPHGKMGTWEQGNLQVASSPLLLDDEIRFYYAASTRFHGERSKKKMGDSGLGLATTKPDRFIGLHAGDRPGEILSRTVCLRSPEVFINANIAKNGWVKIEMLDDKWKPIQGFQSRPIAGNGTALPVVWKGAPKLDRIVMKPIRFRLKAKNAKVYSVWMADGDRNPVYYRFRAPGYRDPIGEISPNPWWW